MNPEQLLLKLGFKKNQAKVYLACLELGMATGGQIATKAGIQRTYFYDLVKELVDRGFVIQTTRGRRKYFTAVNPEKLAEVGKERLVMIEKTLPQLKSIFNASGVKPKVSFYEGREGLGEVYEDTFRQKGEILSITTERVVSDKNRDLSIHYMKERVAKKIPIRVIAPIGKEIIEEKKRENALREIRMLPRDVFTSDVEINIYGNKVDFINFNKEFSLILESDEIASALRKIFEIVWSSGKIIE